MVVDNVLKKDMAGWWMWLETSSTGRKIIKYYCCFFSYGVDDFFLSLKPGAGGWAPFQLCDFSVDEEEQIVFSDQLGTGMMPYSHLTYKKHFDDGSFLLGKPGRGEAFLKKIDVEAVPQFMVQDLNSWFDIREEADENLGSIGRSIPVCFRSHLNRNETKGDKLSDEDFVSGPDAASGETGAPKESAENQPASEEYEASGRHPLMLFLESKLRYFKWELSASEEKRNDFVMTIIGSIIIVIVLRLIF